MLIVGLIRILGDNTAFKVRLDPEAVRIGVTLIGHTPAVIKVVDGLIDLGTLSLAL